MRILEWGKSHIGFDRAVDGFCADKRVIDLTTVVALAVGFRGVIVQGDRTTAVLVPQTDPRVEISRHSL
jgi:hypothetical protein